MNDILEDIMANFGLIDLKLGLYIIKVNVNAGKNKFKVHI